MKTNLLTISYVGKNIKQDLLDIGIYYGKNDVHDPDKLKWWYWKDK